MWPLLKSELRYSKHAWMSGYGACAIFLAMAVAGRWGLVSFVAYTTIAYVVALARIGIEADTQQRTRANALLPLRPRQLALTELAYVTLFQLGIVLFWITLLAFKAQPLRASTVWGLISHNGFILSVTAVFIIHTHLGFYRTRYISLKYLLWLAVVGAIALLAYLKQLEAVPGYFLRHGTDWSGALASTLLWLGLSYLSVAVYVRRRSYLG
jgi:hypothetical protein